MRALILFVAAANLLHYSGKNGDQTRPAVTSLRAIRGAVAEGLIQRSREPNTTNATNLTPQDRVQPMVEAAADGQACNTELVLTLEAAWVSACFNWDNTDPNLHSMLQKWVNYPKSELTRAGWAEVCVVGVPCIDAVHEYYNAFVEEGCAERLQMESTYKLAVSLEKAADSCAVVGPQAALDYHAPASDVAMHPNSLTGCYHDYPACAPHCLMLPFTPGLPGAQRLGELYYVDQTCYKANSRCQGCLFKPTQNPDDLQPWNCPEIKCADPARYAPEDAPVLTPADCKPHCPGGKSCGSDGCGGSCGVCELDETCIEQNCVFRPFSERYDPKDDRDVPDWFKEERSEMQQSDRADNRESALVSRYLPDFGRSPMAVKLGIDGSSPKPGVFSAIMKAFGFN